MNDGGPAFPVLSYEFKATGDLHPAPTMHGGMSLRDYFAAKAMQALITCDVEEPLSNKALISAIALSAYQMADAMIVERSKQK